MQSEKDLSSRLYELDGRGYKAYKSLKGAYDYGDFELIIDYVQGDPFASPSRVILRVRQSNAGFPEDTYHSKSREVALRDYLTRQIHTNAKAAAKNNRGSGKSGKISIDAPGQEILERSAAFATGEEVEARISVGLPAFGRKIAGKQANAMFMEEIPEIVERSLFYSNLDAGELYEHIKTNEDADYLRNSLDAKGLIAFVADGSILPRKSGISQKPMEREKAVEFQSPESMRVEIELPNYGSVNGMGVPKGVTLIVGGGYHGKSTVLNALELGVYNHIPNDGREKVVANSEAAKIRAEDGRYIEKTNISPFISNLPFGKDTVEFSSENASGSTSQAANIIEALEVGAKCLLIDEDTSATNFMIRDESMQKLVAKDKEPITPFVDKAKQLYEDYGISTVLVIGGSGIYFDIADKVICMDNYAPYDLSERAREIAESGGRKQEGGGSFGEITQRSVIKNSIDAQRGKKMKIKSRGTRLIQFGRQNIELRSVEQLIDESQTRAIGKAIFHARKYMDDGKTLNEVCDAVLADMETIDAVEPNSGGLAKFRKLELAAAINRLRSLRMERTR